MSKKKRNRPRRKTFKDIRAAAWPASEQELAQVVVDWLEDRGWTTYKEVEVWPGGPVADIIAVHNTLQQVWIIEAKRRLNLMLLAQAARWKDHAHMVSIALPSCLTTGSWELTFARQICDNNNIGWLGVSRNSVVQRSGYVVHGTMVDMTRTALCEEHRTYVVAGTASGKHWSPFKKTTELLKKHVQVHPGIPLTETVHSIEHHYKTNSSAVAALKKMITKRVISGIIMEQSGQQLLLYATAQQK